MKASPALSLIPAFIILLLSCNKWEYLDANSDETVFVADKISDLQAILDNTYFMNGDQLGLGVNPIIGEAAADNYYITPDGYAVLNSVSSALQNIYTWNDNIYNLGMVHTDWSFPYRAVFHANSAINGLAEIKDRTGHQAEYDNVEGSALFFRSEMFYELAQIYAPPYDKDLAALQWGIPVKLSADISEPVERATVAATYHRITSDLKKAIPLLPVTPLYKTRPSRPAACALLARVYLAMREYDSARVYADASWQLHDKLIDYNNGLPHFAANDEMIFHSNLINTTIYTLFNPSVSRVDTILYGLYEPNDLRRTVLFENASTGGHFFNGGYSGSFRIMWGGIAADEVLLIRAECYARNSNVSVALAALNSLLAKRYAAGTFVPYATTDANELLQLILVERRKELIFRGHRWTDLRRLNSESANIGIARHVAGKSYELMPGSLYYTFLIPPDVIGFNPGMPQNDR